MADNTSPFNQQLSKWWELVSAKDTWDAFKNFFKLIWTIIVETGMLIYLFILGALVSIGWVVDRSSDLTENVKSLQSQANQAEEGNLFSEAGKSLWSATKQGADNALQTARSTLNVKAPARKSKVDPPQGGKAGNQTDQKQKVSNEPGTRQEPPAGSPSAQDNVGSQGGPASPSGDSTKQNTNGTEQETVYEDNPQ